MKFLLANRIAPDEKAESHLGLYGLPMSHKKDAMLIWVNVGFLGKLSGLAKASILQTDI